MQLQMSNSVTSVGAERDCCRRETEQGALFGILSFFYLYRKPSLLSDTELRNCYPSEEHVQELKSGGDLQPTTI